MRGHQMKIVAFIRTLAFMMSVFVKIVAFPFVEVLKLYKVCYKKGKRIKGRKKSSGERPKNVLIKMINMIYVMGRTVYLKIVYVIYQRIYHTVTKNKYIELFFVFFTGFFNTQRRYLNIYRILSTKEYVQRYEKSEKFEIIEEGRSRTVCIPEYFEKREEELEYFISPDIYIAEIQNVCLIGGSNALTVRDVLLNDIAYYDKENRVDIRYSAIRSVINGVAIIEDQEECVEIEKGINLVGAASFNYYHLVVEILSKLTFVDKKAEYHHCPILVDEVVLKIPQFYAALKCVNKFEHPIIKIEKGKKYSVNSLVIPSSVVWMPTNVYYKKKFRTSDFLISEMALNNIREAVGVIQEQKPEKNIFISRKNTKTVRLKNEKVVRELFAENGFEIVFTEEMTFREQVECFGRARCIVAASGAALTNIIFCQPGTIIGCIFPLEHNFYMYSTIAYLLKLRPFFLDGQIVERTPYISADSFIVDEDYVRRYIFKVTQDL